MNEPMEHEGKPREDPREGAEPDRQGTTDAEAGVMESDIAAEPPGGGAGGAEPAAPEAPPADGAQQVPRQAGAGEDPREEAGRAQPESSAQKLE